MSTNKIQKNIFITSSRARVWRALTDSKEFGSWFGMRLDGPFVARTKISGVILQKPHEGKAVELFIESIEPENLFSLKWHPFAVDHTVDYSQEPMTLVTFYLEEQKKGILLTVTETGFEQLPISRRAQALKANDGGWSKQMELIEKYLRRGG